MKYRIYTDGGITFKTKVGSFALVVVDENDRVLRAWAKLVTDTTSSRTELYGVLNALRWAANHNEDEVEIITDSQYVQKGITEWMRGWKELNWSRGAEPVANVDIWKRIDRIYSTLDKVTVTWIKGHAGHEFNELADQICTLVKRGESWRHLLRRYTPSQERLDFR